MKFIKVDGIPAAKEFSNAGKAIGNVKAFFETGPNVAEVDFSGDYKSSTGCFAGLRSAIKRHNLPARVFSRSGRVYIAREE